MKSLLSALFSIGCVSATVWIVGAVPSPVEPTEKQVIGQVAYRAAVEALAGQLPRSAEFPFTSIVCYLLPDGAYKVRGQVLADFGGTKSHGWTVYLKRFPDGWMPTNGVTLDDDRLPR